MSTNIIAPTEPEPDADSPDHDCPRCGGSLDAVADLQTAVEYECDRETCEYEELDGDLPFLNGYLQRLLACLIRATWPYTHGLVVLVVFVCGLLSVTYGPVTNSMGADGFLFVLAGVVWYHIVTPGEYCPSCGKRIRDDDAAFCWNCGDSVADRIAVVDLDATPRYRVWRERVAARLPDGIERRGLSLRVETSGNTEFLDRLLDGRKRAWSLVFDIGIAVMIAAYTAILAAGVAVAWHLHTTATPVFGSESGSNSGSEEVALSHISPDLALAIVTVVVAFCISLWISVSLHELGHGLAYRLHGHDVDQFAIIAFLGVFPNMGLTSPDVDVTGETGLRPALQTAAGGLALNTLAAVPVGVFWLVAYGSVPSIHGGFTAWFATSFLVVSAVSIVNVLPVGGSDGDHFQRYIAHAFAERLGVDQSFLVAFYATQTLVYGLLLAIGIGVVL